MIIFHFFDLIKISHTIFSLVFGIITILLNYKDNSKIENIPLALLCIFFARNAAMAFNQLVDKSYDKMNPRTQNRPLIQNKISTKNTIYFILINSILFLFCSFQIHITLFLISPFLISLLFFYSFWKRFSFLSHFYLGIVIGMTPISVDLAINFNISPTSIFLFLWMALWISGFDIIYSISDIKFDQKESLYSIPSYYSEKFGIYLSKILYALSLSKLIVIGYIQNFTPFYFLLLNLILGNFLLQFYFLSIKKNLIAFSLNLYIPIIYLSIIIIEILLV